MLLTDYHAKYFAHQLTKRYSSDNLEKLAGAFAGAQVDLNPHQVDAALFAFKSPFSKGAILADEVGLGKTIEAGLVISQKWAERKRRILVIAPSTLRKQWCQELLEKFFIPCTILETEFYNAALKSGNSSPFNRDDSIVICSYQFARNKANDIANIPWNLVVIDEAHRLRNVYKPSNLIAVTLKRILKDKHKLLLTATPLQNSLLELFGLVSFIDELTFGDLKSFREQFSNLNNPQTFQTLKERIKPICHRTLRRQVEAYIPFTKRHAILEEFIPEKSEERLYNLVSEYLRRDNLQAISSSQKALTTLVLRKLLASSTFAIAGALASLSNRLKAKLNRQRIDQSLVEKLEKLDDDYEALNEISDEWGEEDLNETLSQADHLALECEIAELDEFVKLATSIKDNAKGKALLKVLETAFKETTKYGGAPKAIIFTESRRTQNYLLRLLKESSWRDGIILFNGSNHDEQSKAIYTDWLVRYENTDHITGSKTADLRSAIVDYFREQGRIMIATEAGAEGINLQFCSLVINYDLPWNPQRIEQRIGRCHRYGQKHDVIVVNFLNKKNAADRRVLELLSEKFQLFDGVFGTSDEVLGAIESGVEFEKRISNIYQSCRKREEIEAAFDQLQLELSFEINNTITQTRRKLLENFDDEVREKLKIRENDSKETLDRFERLLMQITRHELDTYAEFLNESTFRLIKSPNLTNLKDISLGIYTLPRKDRDCYTYHFGHPLVEAVLHKAKNRNLPISEIHFDYSNYQGKISILEPLVGKSGFLSLSLFSVESLEQAEDYLIFAAVTDENQRVDEEIAQRLFSLPGIVVTNNADVDHQLLEFLTQQRQHEIQSDISQRNTRFFEIEAEKLDTWADDLKITLEHELRELDRQIKEAKRAAASALTLEEKLAGQKQVKAMEAQRSQKRRSLFNAQDEVDLQRDQLIAQIEGKLKQTSSIKRLFTIRWSLQ